MTLRILTPTAEMKKLILLCIGLLTGRQCVALVETPATNNTKMRQNFKQSSPGSEDTDTKHTGNVRNTSSGSDVIDPTHNGDFSSISTGYDITQLTKPDDYTTTITGNDRTTTTYLSNGEFFYTNSEYNKIDKTLSSATPLLHTSTGTIDLHGTTLLSNTTSRIHGNKLVPITTASELIDTTYSSENSLDVELRKNQANNETKPERGVENDQGEGNGKEESSEDCMCIIWYTIWSIIGLVGIVANVCLSMVFILRKEMRTFPNLMIMNLTVSDIFCLLINIPIYIVDDTSSSWQFGEFLCQFYNWTRFLMIGASVYSVAVISLQRFFALMIFKTNAFHCLMAGKYKTFLLLIFVWTLAGALALRYSVNLYVENFQYYVSDDDGTFQKRNDLVDLIVYCVIPLTIIGFSTAATSIRLKKSARNMPGEVCVQSNARRDRVVSSNVLLALTIVFALSYVPFFSYYVYLNWNEIDVEENINNAVYGLLFANSCFNPIALFTMSRKYRRILVNDIICRSKDNSENSAIAIQTIL